MQNLATGAIVIESAAGQMVSQSAAAAGKLLPGGTTKIANSGKAGTEAVAPSRTIWANRVTGLADDLAKYAHNIKPKAGFTDVFIHSTTDSFHVLHNGSWVKLSHRSVANYLQSKGVTGNLRLISCEAGQAQLAQNLANKLKITVEAATTKVGVPTNFVSDPLLEVGGRWIQFLPR